MSFLSPAFLFGVLTVAIPIIIHALTRHRAPRVDFSDIRPLVRRATRGPRRRRLRDLLLLALRVTALLLLALAFARPVLDAVAGADATTVVVVDRSLSMSAPGQIAQAQALARDVVAAAAPSHAVAVVAFDHRGEVMQAPTSNRAAARAAIDRIEPTAGRTAVGAGLASAGAVLRGRPGRLVVVTDAQAVAGDDEAGVPLPPGTTVELRVVPPVARNLAVTAVAARDGMVAATVVNTTGAAVETTLAVEVDGRAVRDAAVSLEAGTTDHEWALETPGAVVSVRVEDGEGYRWDNARHAWLAPVATEVLLVAGEGSRADAALYLEPALAVGPADRPFRVRRVAPAAVAAIDAPQWESTSVIVLLSTLGLSHEMRRRLATFVRAGGGLLVATGPGVDPRLVELDDLLGGAVVATASAAGGVVRRLAVTDARHPMFRPLGDAVATLGQVRFHRTLDLARTEASPARALARFDQGFDALIEVEAAAGRVLIFASDLDNRWNDFPRHPVFVPFLHEAIRYLAGPPPASRVVRPAEVPPGRPARPEVATGGLADRPVIVNSDPRESVVRTVPADRFLADLEARIVDAPAEPATGSGGGGAAGRALWRYVLAALLVVLLGEAWLGRAMA